MIELLNFREYPMNKTTEAKNDFVKRLQTLGRVLLYGPINTSKSSILRLVMDDYKSNADVEIVLIDYIDEPSCNIDLMDRIYSLLNLKEKTNNIPKAINTLKKKVNKPLLLLIDHFSCIIPRTEEGLKLEKYLEWLKKEFIIIKFLVQDKAIYMGWIIDETNLNIDLLNFFERNIPVAGALFDRFKPIVEYNRNENYCDYSKKEIIDFLEKVLNKSQIDSVRDLIKEKNKIGEVLHQITLRLGGV